jgi:hypothetical protein
MYLPLNISLISVVLAAVAAMGIGMVWYSPKVFGSIWMNLSGVSESVLKEMKEKGMAPAYLAAFVSCLVMSYILAFLMNLAQVDSVLGGACIGFIIWLGFISTVLLGGVLWEGKSTKLYAVKVIHYLFVLIVMGSILGYFSR